MTRGAWFALVVAVGVTVAVVMFSPEIEEAGEALTDRVIWARAMWAAIGAELPQLSTEAKVLILAHATYESGWGTARAAKRGNNVFNITAGSAWTGAAWDDASGDTEYDAQGNLKPGRIDQRWRIYDSLRHAVRDYWTFLGPNANRGRYVKARAALENGNVGTFATELYAAGYFTLPASKYATQLGAVVASVRAVLA